MRATPKSLLNLFSRILFTNRIFSDGFTFILIFFIVFPALYEMLFSLSRTFYLLQLKPDRADFKGTEFQLHDAVRYRKLLQNLLQHITAVCLLYREVQSD